MKVLKYILFGILIFCTAIGALTVTKISKEYIKDRFLISKIPSDSVRMHFLSFGKSKSEAVNETSNLIDIPAYTLIDVRLTPFQTGGSTWWICDVTIDVKKSALENPSPKNFD